MAVFDRLTSIAFTPDEKTQDHYWVVGNTSKAAFLIIPGYSATHEGLVKLAEDLKEHFFVILPELPGWGDSPPIKNPLTIHNYAKYLHQLLQHQQKHKVIVLGHCMGATVAIEFAYLFPQSVSQLILVSTPYMEGTISHELFMHLANLSHKSPKFIRSVFYIWRSRLFVLPYHLFMLRFRNYRKKLEFITKLFSYQPKQDEDAVEENWYSLMNYRYQKIKDVNIPLHLIHGGEDILVQPQQAIKLHSLVPFATLDFIPHAGHLPPVETPGSLTSLVLKYT